MSVIPDMLVVEHHTISYVKVRMETSSLIDDLIVVIDPCEDKKRKMNLTNLNLCPNKNEHPEANGRICDCECNDGFRRSKNSPYACDGERMRDRTTMIHLL